MPFIPHTEDDIREMLAAIRAEKISDLFDEIPRDLLIRDLDGIPEAISEMEVARLMRGLAGKDGAPLCFAGAGAYEHHIPAVVWDIATRGEYYSAYTPYQAEASQGTLQTIYEFQSMMVELTGMDVSNASLYDGASAVAEAALMAVRANRRSKSTRVLLSAGVNPVYEKVAQAIAGNQGLVTGLPAQRYQVRLRGQQIGGLGRRGGDELLAALARLLAARVQFGEVPGRRRVGLLAGAVEALCRTLRYWRFGMARVGDARRI